MAISSAILGERVREIRRDLGLTQQELAQKAGVSTGFISLFENGERGISLDQLNELGRALGVGPEVLVLLATEGRDSQRSGAADELAVAMRELAQRIVSYAVATR